MKKITFLTSVLMLFLSCSKGEDVNTPVVQNYAIEITDSCPLVGAYNPIEYCISKETYESLQTTVIIPCRRVTFKTLDNQQKSGYLASYGASPCN